MSRIFASSTRRTGVQSCLKTWKTALRQTPSSTRAISQISLPPDTPIEEETLPYYEPEHYYPVNIGDIYKSRYQTTGKLGYGAYSTSWLCRDLQENKYRTLKISTSLPKYPTSKDREFKIYHHLASTDSTHPGQSLIRELYDSFGLDTSVGSHRCLVLQPMHMTLLEMMGLNSRPFDLPLLKVVVGRVLLGLDFLHAGGVVHADLKMDNLMLSLESEGMLVDFADAKLNDPSRRKKIDQVRSIYKSRKFRRPVEGESYGLPILCDFSEARIGKTHESGPFIQPHIYRAPEVIFEMPWGSAIDIWNLACLTWDLFEGRHLFGDIFDAKRSHDPFRHLALIVALIGPPPSTFVARSETAHQCFDPSGAWIADQHAAIPSLSLEILERASLWV